MENRDNRKQTSPENAKHSTGPRTEQGKARSAQNATNHGAYSKKILLPGEDEAALNRLVQNHIDRLQPQDELETTIVLQMAHILWRSFRIAPAESALLHIQMHRMKPAIQAEFKTYTAPDLMALASAALQSNGQGPNHLTRLEARLQRQYHRLMPSINSNARTLPRRPTRPAPGNRAQTSPSTRKPTN